MKVQPDRFSMVTKPSVPRSAFSWRSTHKTTFNAPYLIPVFVQEVLPGDQFNVRMTAFARLSTPVVPIMDNLELESHFFFVPNRLVWSNWARMMGEQTSPSDTTEFLTPQCTVENITMPPTAIGTLADYFGITNNGSGNNLSVIAFPWRAYNLIWNTWFRDEDLQTPVTVLTGDGPDSAAVNYIMLARGKRHDYFTSARPWPMKPVPNWATGSLMPGSQDTTLVGQGFTPGTQFFNGRGVGAPVTGIGVIAGSTVGGPGNVKMSGGRTVAPSQAYSSATATMYMTAQSTDSFPDVRVLANDLRTAMLMQGMMELNARGGTRYTELIQAHFGVRSPDARLQRPEFLGGGRSWVTVNPVAQTSATGVAGTSTVLGEQAGVASVLASRHGFSQAFTEHGFVIGLISVRSDLTYQQGLDRFWKRRSPYDYYWPGLAHLGEQVVLSSEIYSDGSGSDATVFGYQERWAEYRSAKSMTSGYFRSTVATPLDEWHLAQEFVARPVLNSAFVTETAPIDRVLQVSTNYGQQFLADVMFDVTAVRCMPMFSIPGVGDRL